MHFKLSDHPHRRLNILTGEWILVSPHRALRPWQGQVEKSVPELLPSYDSACYLCPGNERAHGIRNPNYDSTFVFTNDFSALLLDSPAGEVNTGGLLVAESEAGTCRVVCFSPRHNLTLPEMEARTIRKVVDVWTAEYRDLGARSEIHYVQIFENKGAVMGCSNPHPHGQIWAERMVPVEPEKELNRQRKYLEEQRACLLCDYLLTEAKLEERFVCENAHFYVLVPFWAVWPFETIVLSKRHCGSLVDLSESEKNSFAEILQMVTVRYDNLFSASFPYSSGIHQSPTDGVDHPESHFHMHFYPPLLRSATIKKFMVGYEMLANPQRDITPELSAERLRALPDRHYKT